MSSYYLSFFHLSKWVIDTSLSQSIINTFILDKSLVYRNGIYFHIYEQPKFLILHENFPVSNGLVSSVVRFRFDECGRNEIRTSIKHLRWLAFVRMTLRVMGAMMRFPLSSSDLLINFKGSFVVKKQLDFFYLWSYNLGEILLHLLLFFLMLAAICVFFNDRFNGPCQEFWYLVFLCV